MAQRMNDKAVLVTGGGGGIGRAAAEIFAREGARVMVVDIKDDGGSETVARITAQGGEAFYHRADVTNETAVATMIDTLVAQYGRLDCAFNNAGVTGATAPFYELSLADWQRMLEINLTSVFLCMKYELKQLLTQKPGKMQRGSIVNTSSGAGFVAAPGQPHYTATKHGVLGLTKHAAGEFARQAIRVNAICPGATDTPMTQDFLATSPEAYENMKNHSPRGHLAQPEDIALAAVWLCSEESHWVSGVSMVVDGGGLCR